MWRSVSEIHAQSGSLLTLLILASSGIIVMSVAVAADWVLDRVSRTSARLPRAIIREGRFEA